MNFKIINSNPNFVKICRLCLKESSSSIDIFNSSKLSLRIMTTTSLEVQSTDGLPNSICQECRVQLEKSYIFRKRCQFSDTKLRKHLRLINSGKISKIFEPNEEEQDEDNFDFEESLNFLSIIENEKKKETEKIWKARERVMIQELRAQEIDNIFEEFKNYVLMKSQKISKDKIETFFTTPAEWNEQIEINNAKFNNIDDHDNAILKTKRQNFENNDKNILVFEENAQENELILVVENAEEYDIQEEENYDSEFEDENKNFHQNDTDLDSEKEINTMLEDIDQIEGYSEEAHIHNEDKNIQEIDKNKMKEIQKTEKNINSRKITHATKDEDIIKMEINERNENDKKRDQDKKNEYLKIFKCSHCPQSFTRRLLLQRHNSVHLRNKEYCCVHCKKWFACKSSLDRHTRTHTGEKPFECSECGKKFIQREILKRHMHLHTGKKPFKCSHCDQSFVQKQVLQNHINLKHTENPVVKMHDCFLCMKSFMHASGLSRHLVLHSGVSFYCSHCGKQFTDKSAVKRHELAVHKIALKNKYVDNSTD